MDMGWIESEDGQFARATSGRLTALAGRVTDDRWFWTIVEGPLGPEKPHVVVSEWVKGGHDECLAGAEEAMLELTKE